MNDIKIANLDKKFCGVDDLYSYLIKNQNFIENITGITLDKTLQLKNFCVIGREKIVERKVVFFASNRDLPESLGELIVFTSAYDADIAVFFLKNCNKNYLMPLTWLQKICQKDYQFIVIKANY